MDSCNNTSSKEMWPELNEVLEAFAELFEEPKWLPPPREEDHRIVLKQGANAVNIRPYKYAAKQKDIIEAMVREMLTSGVIKHSNSPFASPIVLVKKDSSWRMCVDYRSLNSITIKK